jgi:hypothetical protein
MTKAALLMTAINIMFVQQSLAAPSTADFMNATTACGAGSTVKIDAQLKGSMQSLYDKEATSGRATQEILVEIAKLLPQGKTYELYLDCLKTLLKN